MEILTIMILVLYHHYQNHIFNMCFSFYNGMATKREHVNGNVILHSNEKYLVGEILGKSDFQCV